MTPTPQETERKWRREAKASRLASFQETINGRAVSGGRNLPPLLPESERPARDAQTCSGLGAVEPELAAASLELARDALALLGLQFRSTGPDMQGNAGYQKGNMTSGSSLSRG